MVSCGATSDEYNLFTAAWTGTICSDPAMCYVSIRPERHSHAIVERNMAFTINLTNEQLARATDWCGVRSGRDCNKWKEMGLTPVKGVKVAAPYIDDERFINPTSGALDLKAAGLITYCHGHYYKLGEEIGHFGWTVRKHPK